MRGVRQPQFPRHVREEGVSRQMRRLGDIVIACLLLAINDPQHATPAWAQPMTPVGEFLRYTRIEALPQLINVLRGEMTLIDSFSPPFVD